MMIQHLLSVFSVLCILVYMVGPYRLDAAWVAINGDPFQQIKKLTQNELHDSSPGAAGRAFLGLLLAPDTYIYIYVCVCVCICIQTYCTLLAVVHCCTKHTQ